MNEKPKPIDPEPVAAESLEHATGGASYQTACVNGSKVGTAVGLTAGLLTGAPIAGAAVGAVAGCLTGMAAEAIDRRR